MQIRYAIEDDRHVYYLSGGFTFSEHTAFRSILQDIAKKSEGVTIDLQGVDFIDSAGLGMLLLARDEAQTSQHSLILRHPRGHVQKMFALSQFDQLFTIVA